MHGRSQGLKTWGAYSKIDNICKVIAGQTKTWKNCVYCKFAISIHYKGKILNTTLAEYKRN